MLKYSKIGVLLIVVLLLVGTVFAGENADVVLSADVSATAVRADTPTEVTLEVSVQGAANVSAIGVSVEYDPSAAQVVGGQMGAFLQDANLSAPLDTAKAGTVGVGGAIVPADAATAPDGDGLLATFTFSVTLAEGEETALTVSKVELLGVPASEKDVFADVATKTLTGRGVVIGSVSISPSSRGRTSVAVGGTQVFTVTAKDTDGNTVDVSDMVVWAADEMLGTLAAVGDTATLTAATKVVVDASLTATVGDISAEVLVTLSPGPLATLSMSIVKPNPQTVLSMQGRKLFRAGQAIEFAAAGKDEYGNAVDVTPIWSVENDDPGASIGRISMLSGKMTAATTVMGLGNNGTVKATKGAIEASIKIRVFPGRPDRLEVEPTEITVKVGERVDFSATVYDEYDNVVEGPVVVWGVVGDIGEFVGFFGTFEASDTPGTGIVVAFSAPFAFGGTLASVNAASKVTVVADVPEDFEIQGNYPNPFNPETTVRYALPKDEAISVVIYDVMGQEVTRLLDGVDQKAGYHSIVWDGRNAVGQEVASGVYFCTMRAGTFRASRKMTLLR